MRRNGDRELRELSDCCGFHLLVLCGAFITFLCLCYAEFVEQDGRKPGTGMSHWDTWNDEALEELGMVRLTNELYDEVVYPASEKWLLVFSRDHIPEIPIQITEWNESIKSYVKQIRKENPELKIAYCDVHFWGLLLKQTFDISNIPAMRLAQYNRVYHMEEPAKDKFWETKHFRKFLKDYRAQDNYDYKRPRVTYGLSFNLELVMNQWV